jgi:hypothetical protein
MCSNIREDPAPITEVYIAFSYDKNFTDSQDMNKLFGTSSIPTNEGFIPQALVKLSEILPIDYLFQLVVVEKKKVIVCGYGFGGAIAEIYLLNALRTFNDPIWIQNVQLGKVAAVTFGAPLFCDDTLRKTILEKGWNNIFTHVISFCDPFPLLSYAIISRAKSEASDWLEYLNMLISTLTILNIISDNFFVVFRKYHIKYKKNYIVDHTG